MTDFPPRRTATPGQGRRFADPAAGTGSFGGQDTAPPGQGRKIVKPAVLAGGQDTGELLTRLRTSEPGVALQLYDRFADRVYDFVLFLTRDSAMAAETTRDVIVMTAHQEPAALADPAGLRAWLYAQARNETFALLSTRGRTPADDRVVDIPPLPASPTTADLGGLIWTAMGAFTERDQALVTLHLRHGLSDGALSNAMGLSAGAVDVLLPSTLERVEAQLDALLALATGRVPDAACTDLHEVSADWDGMFSPLVRGRVTQMLEECGGPVPADVPGPMSLLQSIPLVPAPAALRDAVADRLDLSSRLGAGVAQVEAEIDDTIPPSARRGVDHQVLAVAPADAETIPPGEGPTAGAGPAAPYANAAPSAPTGWPTQSEADHGRGRTASTGGAVVALDEGTVPTVAPGFATVPGVTAGEDRAGTVESDAAAAAGGSAGPDWLRDAAAPDDGGAETAPGGVRGAGPGDDAPSRADLSLATPGGPGPTPIGGHAPSIGDEPRRAPTRTPLPLAVALGIAVGLVVAALIFRIVGADVAPAEDPPAVVVSPAAPDNADGVTAPLTGSTGAALDQPVATPTPTPAPAPGRLSGPGDEVVLQRDEVTALRLTNPGGETLAWRVTDLPAWVQLDRLDGEIDPAATVEIAITYGESLGEGDYSGAVTFAWDGTAPGMLSVPLVGAIELTPDLQNLQVGSRSLGAQGCGLDQTEVAVLVTDDSPLAQVLVTADGPDPGTQTQFALAPDPDPAQADRYVGVVGPFQGAGQVAARIQAVDARGNEAIADGGALGIAAC